MKEKPRAGLSGPAKAFIATTPAPWFGRLGVVALVSLAVLGGVSCVGGGDKGDESAALCAPQDPTRYPPNASRIYPYGALPKGLCSSPGATCSIAIHGPCGDDPDYAGHPINVYQCRCRVGSWTCEVVSRGGSICSNQLPRDAANEGTAASDAHDAQDLGRSDGADVFPRADTANDSDRTHDVGASDTAAECRTLDENACLANARRCYRVAGTPLEQICSGSGDRTFTACVTGGPDGGAAQTWARDPESGRYVRFTTTQIPEGWERADNVSCPDAGAPDGN